MEFKLVGGAFSESETNETSGWATKGDTGETTSSAETGSSDVGTPAGGSMLPLGAAIPDGSSCQWGVLDCCNAPCALPQAWPSPIGYAHA